LYGLKGGVLAGLFFIVPSLLIIFGLSALYVHYGNSALLIALFSGLKPAVLAIIIFATFRVGQKSLVSIWHYLVALAAFLLSYFAGVPMLWIIVGVIAFGVLCYAILSKTSKINAHHEKEDKQLESVYYINTLEKLPPISYRRISLQVLLFFLLWLIPLSILLFFTIDTEFWKTLSFLFTKSAYLTIGGSYTIIPYVAALVTEKLFWLSKSQMIDGFALAETTPGPLVVVLAYVGFMAGFNHFHQSYSMAALGLIATAYFTFLPNFALIFVGAPLIERTQKNACIQFILSLVTASVVGVIVNLACYLGLGILFPGGVSSWYAIEPMALVWVLFSLFLLFNYKIGMLKLILLSLAYGFLLFLWR